MLQWLAQLALVLNTTQVLVTKSDLPMYAESAMLPPDMEVFSSTVPGDISAIMGKPHMAHAKETRTNRTWNTLSLPPLGNSVQSPPSP